MSEYAEVDSFELSTVDAYGAGPDEVALLGDDRVVHVGGGERTTVSTVEDAVDVAVGSLVYVLEPGQLLALDPDAGGSRVWSVGIDDATVEAVAAMPASNVVCVLTTTELFGVDAEHGSRRWTTDRPYADVGDDGGLAAGADYVLHDTWTFVTGFDADGEATLDETFDGAVEDAGSTGAVVVVALKTGTLLGVDVDEGTVQWEAEISARTVRDGGQNGLLVGTDDGVLHVSADGSYQSVAGLSSGAMFPARDGNLVCVHSEGTCSVYRRRVDPEDIEATVETELLSPGDELSVGVRNGTEGATSVPVEVGVDGATLADETATVDVPADDWGDASFDVTEAGRVEEATVVVSVVNDVVEEATVPIDRPDPESVDVHVELDVDRVEGSTIHGTLTVENEGDASPRLSVLEEDATVGVLGAGQSTTVTVSAPYVPGEPIERTVVDDVGEPVAIASAERADGRTTVDLGQSADDQFLFVDVNVANATDATVSDELVVFGLGDLDPVERDVECAPGATWTLSLAVPGGVATALDGNTVRAQLDGTAANDALALEVDDDLADAGVEDAPASGPTGAAGGAGVGAGPAGPVASVERSTSAESVGATERFREFLAVDAARDVDALSLVVDGSEHAVGSIPGGTELRFERSHAVEREGRHSLDPVRAVVGGEPVDEDDCAIEVVDGPLAVRTHVSHGGGRLRIDGAIRNRTSEYVDLVGVHVEGVGTWDLELGSALAPGEVVEWAGDVEAATTDVTASVDALPTVVEYGDPTAPATFESLAAVERSSGDSLLDRIDVAVGEDTRVRDEYSSVALELTNVGDAPERDVEVGAVGDVVNDVVYVPQTYEEIAPGETVVHPIDVKPNGASLHLEAELAAGDASERVALEGPVADHDGEWTREDYEAWSATPVGESDDADVSYPDHVATGYERTH